MTDDELLDKVHEFQSLLARLNRAKRDSTRERATKELRLATLDLLEKAQVKLLATRNLVQAVEKLYRQVRNL